MLLQFGKKGKMLPYTGAGKPLHDKSTNLKVKGDNNCHFHSIAYLLTGFQDQHFTFIEVLCSYVADEHNFLWLQLWPFEYKSGRDYIVKMKF